MTNRGDLGELLRRRRVMIPLTLAELARASGVSPSHLGRIERGGRFPSAHTLRKIAQPLGFGESELFALAGYLPQPPSGVEREPQLGQLDPYVATVLSQEPVEIQRAVIAILTVLKSIAQAHSPSDWPEFRDYARSKYPELDDDTITMIEDILEHPPKGN